MNSDRSPRYLTKKFRFMSFFFPMFATLTSLAGCGQSIPNVEEVVAECEIEALKALALSPLTGAERQMTVMQYGNACLSVRGYSPKKSDAFSWCYTELSNIRKVEMRSECWGPRNAAGQVR